MGRMDYFVEWGTRRSQNWASLTMFILYLIGCGLQILSLGLVAPDPSKAVAAVVGLFVMLIFNLTFAAVSMRAFLEIPKYLTRLAANEICVERVKPPRFAGKSGTFEGFSAG